MFSINPCQNAVLTWLLSNDLLTGRFRENEFMQCMLFWLVWVWMFWSLNCYLWSLIMANYVSSISLIVLAGLLKGFWTFKLVCFSQLFQLGLYDTSSHKTCFRLYGKYSANIKCMRLIWERRACFIICLLEGKLALKYWSLVSNPFVFWGNWKFWEG